MTILGKKRKRAQLYEGSEDALRQADAEDDRIWEEEHPAFVRTSTASLSFHERVNNAVRRVLSGSS